MELGYCHPFVTKSLEVAAKFLLKISTRPVLRGLCDMNANVTLVL